MTRPSIRFPYGCSSSYAHRRLPFSEGFVATAPETLKGRVQLRISAAEQGEPAVGDMFNRGRMASPLY
ncbi:hypothetical protein BaRGS_00009417, partial [Batillaria attramentaria]